MIKLLIIGVYTIIGFFITSSLYQPANKPDLNETNKIEIHYLKTEKRFTITNKETIDFFKDLIKNGKNKESLKCDSTGEILYLHDHHQLFKIYFSTRITGSEFTTDAITYTMNNNIIHYALTYNTGMDIDDIFYKLNKAK